MSVEEAWKEWADSESGAACLDVIAFTKSLLSTPYDLDKHLNYRLRAAFVAGWIAKQEAAK